MKEKNSMVSTTVSGNNFLKKFQFSSLTNWSARYLLENAFSYNDHFELVPIGDFLIRNKEVVEIQDGIEYRRVTIKINNNGVLQRDTEKGENIGTKRQYIVREGQFIMSKIDARNGAFGLVPPELDGAIVTNDFPSFHVDNKRIDTQFLVLITTTKEFVRFAQSCSSGTTNRQRINIDLFLQQRIPLPSLEEQQRIIDAYYKKLRIANKKEEEARLLEESIQEFLFNELGIKKFQSKKFNRGVLNFFNFSSTHRRWDIQNDASAIFSSLNQSIYPLLELGDCFEFINRKWKKDLTNDESFNYIELGGVDPLKGVTNVSRLLVKKAPSRATQTVKTGELIIGTTRPYLKRFAIIKESNNNDIVSSGFQIIGMSDNYNLNFLLAYLKSECGVKQFEHFMTGALYPAITSKDLRKVLIPFPSKNVQDKIALNIMSKEVEIKNKIEEARINREMAISEFEKEIFQHD